MESLRLSGLILVRLSDSTTVSSEFLTTVLLGAFPLTTDGGSVVISSIACSLTLMGLLWVVGGDVESISARVVVRRVVKSSLRGV